MKSDDKESVSLSNSSYTYYNSESRGDVTYEISRSGYLNVKRTTGVYVEVINKSKYPLPEYATLGSSGMDVRSNLDEPITLGSLERTVIPTGLFVSIPEGYEIQIRSKSGLSSKHGIVVLNSPGTIDSDYRGEIGIIIANLSNENYTINPGDKIAQMVLSEYTRCLWKETDKLTDTERGEGGFGHTGK